VVLSEEFGRTWYLAPSADVGADVVGSVALGAGPARVYGGVTEGEHCGCVLRFVVLVNDVVLATVMKSDNGKKNGMETICTSTKRASVDGGLFNSGDLKLGIERNAFEGKMSVRG
jgi:hypothetical protein